MCVRVPVSLPHLYGHPVIMIMVVMMINTVTTDQIMATINEGLILKSLIELASMLDPFSEILSIW